MPFRGKKSKGKSRIPESHEPEVEHMEARPKPKPKKKTLNQLLKEAGIKKEDVIGSKDYGTYWRVVLSDGTKRILNKD